jgi:hypothetical protein
MLNQNLQQFLSFLGYFLAQVFLFRHVVLFESAYAFVYVGFILYLPLRISTSFALILAFLMGFCVDAFYDTMGMQAAASVLVAALRPLALQIAKPSGGYENTALPSLFTLGGQWFVFYTLPLLLLHHLLLFMLHTASLELWVPTLLKSLVSVIFTFSCLLLAQFLFYRKK